MVNYNGSDTATITANSGYTLTGATVSGTGCSLNDSTLTFSNVTSNRTCSITAATAETYKYWNYGSIGSSATIAANALPAGGVLTTYTSYAAPKSWIRSTVNGSGTVTKHESCLYYNSKLFCLGANYWTGTIGTTNITEGTNTMNKLKTAMEAALGTTATSCTSNSVSTNCYFGSASFARCYANYAGDVYCNDDSRFARVYSDGRAYCY